MKIKVMSDLHLEFGSKFVFEEQLDTTLVLAGDIDSKLSALQIFLEYVATKFKYVIFVPGNHEYYKYEYNEARNKMLSWSRNNLYVLDNDYVKLDGVNFIGATLWADPDPVGFYNMSDSKLVRVDDRNVTTLDWMNWNYSSKEYIKYMVKEVRGPKVVITHFGPDYRLMAEEWRGANALNSCFWNKELEDTFKDVKYWIFGHTHSSVDEEIDGCRFVCNPFGYIYHKVNPTFDREASYFIFSEENIC